jgi:hypothetical protein
MRGEIVDVEAGDERAVTQRTRAGEEGRLRQDDRLGFGRPEAQQQAQQDEREKETPPHHARLLAHAQWPAQTLWPLDGLRRTPGERFPHPQSRRFGSLGL